MSTLHLELMLNALLAINQKPAREYNLVELFDALPREERRELEGDYLPGRSGQSARTIGEALEWCKDAL